MDDLVERLRELRGLFDSDGALFCSGEYQREVIARVDASLSPVPDEGDVTEAAMRLERAIEWAQDNGYMTHAPSVNIADLQTLVAFVVSAAPPKTPLTPHSVSTKVE